MSEIRLPGFAGRGQKCWVSDSCCDFSVIMTVQHQNCMFVHEGGFQVQQKKQKNATTKPVVTFTKHKREILVFIYMSSFNENRRFLI